MRRLLGRAYTAAAVGSAVLCVAACGLWVRSAGADLCWTLRRPTRVYSFRSRGNVITYRLLTIRPTPPPDPANDSRGCAPLERGVRFCLKMFEIAPSAPGRRFGFGYVRLHVDDDPAFFDQLRPVTSMTLAAAPHWSLALVTLPLPARWLRGASGRRLRRKRARSGLCPTCGYDLRGDVSGVCPECGAPTPKGVA